MLSQSILEMGKNPQCGGSVPFLFFAAMKNKSTVRVRFYVSSKKTFDIRLGFKLTVTSS